MSWFSAGWRDMAARFSEAIDRRAEANRAGVPSVLFHEVDEIQRYLEAMAFDATMADAYDVLIADAHSRAHDGPGWEAAAAMVVREGTGPVAVADILARMEPDPGGVNPE